MRYIVLYAMILDIVCLNTKEWYSIQKTPYALSFRNKKLFKNKK